MVERHYDDEALISLLESNREGRDAHLPSCDPCASKLESFRMIADALHDADVWDTRELRTEAVPATIATLRYFADRMVDEDTRAELILTELLAGERESWLPRLHLRPQWWTAGVVRKLIARAYDAVVTMPPDAVEMMTVATEVADHLDPEEHPSDTVARLRGAAWRDRAYALYYTGRYSDAEAALLVSEKHLTGCAVDSYELARLGIVKGVVYRAFERFQEAMDAADASAGVFEQFDDTTRYASARLAQAGLLLGRGDLEPAHRILCELDVRLRDTQDLDTHARVLGNLGIWATKAGKVDLAVQYLEMSGDIHEVLGATTEAVRTRWAIAEMLMDFGRLDEACVRLQRITGEMEQLGMTVEATVSGLEIAELLLVQERYDQVEAICTRAMESFRRTGIGYGSRALTALAYMSEATKLRHADRKLVRSVREYIRQLPKQPALLFAPPPPNSAE
jgi:tetratricopeptide (TPR) repeat protein